MKKNEAFLGVIYHVVVLVVINEGILFLTSELLGWGSFFSNVHMLETVETHLYTLPNLCLIASTLVEAFLGDLCYLNKSYSLV